MVVFFYQLHFTPEETESRGQERSPLAAAIVTWQSQGLVQCLSLKAVLFALSFSQFLGDAGHVLGCLRILR